MSQVIEVHTKFQHNTLDDPFDWGDLEQHNIFLPGNKYEVPDEAADYFCRAGWASKPGEQPVKPDPTKPVFVRPDNSKLGTSDTN